MGVSIRLFGGFPNSWNPVVLELQLMDIEKEKRKKSKKQCYENIKWEDIKYDTKVTVNLIKIYLEAHSLKKSGKKEQPIDRIKLHIPVCTHTGNEIEESIDKIWTNI